MAYTADEFDNALKYAESVYPAPIPAGPIIHAALSIAAAVMRPGVIEDECYGGDLSAGAAEEAAAIRAVLTGVKP